MNIGIKSIATRLVLEMLRAYKWALSPLLPPACRYVPTCSEYAIEAVERYGVMRGGLVTVWRLLRCHPFAHGGYDPVNRSRPWDRRSHPENMKIDYFQSRGCRVPAEPAESTSVHARTTAIHPGTV